MKKIFRTIGGKLFLFIICLFSICAAIACTVVIVKCWEEHLYTKEEADYFGEHFSSKILEDWLAKYNNYDSYPGYSVENGIIVYPDETNIMFKVYEPVENEDVLIAKTAGYEDYEADTTVYTYKVRLYTTPNSSTPKEIRENVRYYWNYATVSSSWYNFDISLSKEQIVKYQTIKVKVRNRFPINDKYAQWMKKILLGYQYKYLAIVADIISIATAIISFVVLMCVAARRRKDDALYPGPLDSVPFDGLIVIIFIIYRLIIGIFGYAYGLNAYSILFYLSIIAVALYLCMSAASRIKQHTLIKNSLTFILGKKLLRCTKKFFIILVDIIKNIPVYWKAAFILICDFFLNIILFYISYKLKSKNGMEIVIIIFGIKAFIEIACITFICTKIELLQKGAAILAAGNFEYKIDTSDMFPSTKKHAENLNKISEGMTKAVEERIKSERMKTELITNVSHDIKTPLTSIINYAGLINRDTCGNEKHREYSEVLIRQSERLKKLLEDLVEASKASTGNLEVNPAPCEAAVFITQAVGEFEERFKAANLTPVVKTPEEPIMIMADGKRMWRIFDNLLNNICKYSLNNTRVYINLEKNDRMAQFIFKNTSKHELDISEDELLERFVRGDSSRNTEGNGLGLSIAKSMAELQGGTLRVNTDGDLFKAILSIPLIIQS